MVHGVWPVDPQADTLLAKSFALLRDKWEELPATRMERTRAPLLSSLSDDELLCFWDRAHKDHTAGEGFRARGWYELLYTEQLRGKRVLDYGCGLAFDTIHFAQNGAKVTFADLAESNVDAVKRLARLKGLCGSEFLYMEDLSSLNALQGNYDFVLCLGSMINAPLWVLQAEAAAILPHVPIGGRWIEFGYPKTRWIREGQVPFHRWGEKTDGGAPWMEWHDVAKIRQYLAPAQFEVVLDVEFHSSDFNWTDLIRRA